MNKVSRSMIINFTLIWQLLKQKIKETVEEKEREESDHEVIEGTELEAVKQISLGSCDPDNTPPEVVAYRYWVSQVILLVR
jgi:hypothetical protein